MESLWFVLVTVGLCQFLDAASIVSLRKHRPDLRELTIVSRYFRGKGGTKLVLLLKLGMVVATGLLYTWIASASSTPGIWEAIPYLRDALLGAAIVGPLLTAPSRFFILAIGTKFPRLAESADADVLEYWVLLLAFGMSAASGIILFVIAQSVVLLSGAGVAGLVTRANRVKDQEREEEPRKEPASFTPGAKAVLILAVTALIAWSSALAFASATDWRPSDYGGIVQTAEALELSAFGRGIVAGGSSTLEAVDLPGSGLFWGAGSGSLEGFSVETGGQEGLVVVSNGTAILLSANFRQFYIDYFSMKNCTAAGLYRANYTLEVPGANISSFVRLQRGYGANVTFDLSFGAPSLVGYLSLFGQSAASSFFTSCRGAGIYVDGSRHGYNETVEISLRDFGGISAQMRVDHGGWFILTGAASVRFEDSSVELEVEGGSLTRGQDRVEMGGNVSFIAGRSFELSWTASTLRPRDFSAPLAARLSARGVRVISTDQDSSGSLLPELRTDYALAPEGLRIMAFGIILLVGFTAVVAIIHVPTRPHGERRTPAEEVKSKVFAIIMVALLSGTVLGASVGGASISYYYSRQPVRLFVWYEEGLDEDLVRGSVAAFLFQANRLVGFRPSILAFQRVPDDGVREYDSKSFLTWAPAGRVAHDPILMAVGIEESFHISFRTGAGTRFGGINNYGASIFIPVSGPTTPLTIVSILWHEFGHALGLAHNRCSTVMSDDPKHGPRIPSPTGINRNVLYGGRALFEEVRNGTVEAFPGWGTELAHVEMSSANLLLKSTLFMDETHGTLHEVSYIKWTQTGSESVQLRFVPSGLMRWAFSLGELAYILGGISGSAPTVQEGPC